MLFRSTPVDIVRNTLGVGPCQYLLDVEGQKQEHVGRATCHVRSLLNEIYGAGQQKAKRKEIESYLGDALDFVTHIRNRVLAYQSFGHELRKYLAEHGYKVAQVTLDFSDYTWNNPYARCVAKQDAQAIEWLKSTYLSTAKEDIALDRKLSMMLFGRDIKYVLLLHIGALDSIMLPDLLDLFKKQGFDFISLEEAQKDPAYQSDPDAALKFGGTLLEQLTEARHLNYPPHRERPMDKLDAICR